ncbi:uncharacterized protein LOC143605105 [Bidens hawaiensis]|uniref:uncharacterized protein LOC143605105 n=1 Tax=Bidens hawaiensis TaxID=980011 RepID=UPI00404A5D39
MNLARGYRPKKMLPIIGFNTDLVLIIKLPDSRILGVISKSLFLAIFILALPSIGSYVNNASEESSTNPDGFLPMLFEDLATDGLLKFGQKGLVLRSGVRDLFDGFWLLNYEGIDVVTDLDSDERMVVPDEVFDFVFVSSFENVKFIDRVLKIDGIVIFSLGNSYDRGYEFLKLSNYKVVYLRQFDSVTVVAMRKIDDEVEEGVLSE